MNKILKYIFCKYKKCLNYFVWINLGTTLQRKYFFLVLSVVTEIWNLKSQVKAGCLWLCSACTSFSCLIPPLPHPFSVAGQALLSEREFGECWKWQNSSLPSVQMGTALQPWIVSYLDWKYRPGIFDIWVGKLSFPILGGRNSTRALQSGPFQNPGGTLSLTKEESGRRTEILVSNIGYYFNDVCHVFSNTSPHSI